MIIPSLPKLTQIAEAIRDIKPTGKPLLSPVDTNETSRRQRGFGGALLARKGVGQSQNCANGLSFFACEGGYQGCCATYPCNNTDGCPHTIAEPTQTIEARQNAASTTTTRRTTTAATRTVTNGTGTATATVTYTLAPVPTCSSGNVTNYTDSDDIQYIVKCNTNNTGLASEVVQIDSGGYGQCFAACSTSSTCVGFTFDGNTSGTCYLRSTQSSSDDVTVAANTATTCYKVNLTAVASLGASTASTTTSPTSSATAVPSSTPTDSASSSKTPVGAIAGGVIGGIAAIALLIALLLFFIRRNKKAKTASTTLPSTTQDMTQDNPNQFLSNHQRSGSTSHDIYGGGSPNSGKAAAAPMTSADFSELEGHTSTPPGLRAEGRGAAAARVLRPPQMLDGSPVGQGSNAAASRSSVFQEHIVEMEDTSQLPKRNPNKSLGRSPYKNLVAESPVLGRSEHSSTASLADETRRKQHLLSWNNYEDGTGVEGDGQVKASATMMGTKALPSARSADGKKAE